MSDLSSLLRAELLPDLFRLVQRLEKGEIQPKDFENNAGAIRLQLASVRLKLQQIDGICESAEQRREKIQMLTESNERTGEALKAFRERVLRDTA